MPKFLLVASCCVVAYAASGNRWEPSDNSRMLIEKAAKSNKVLKKEMLTVYREMRRCKAKTPHQSLAGALAYGQKRVDGLSKTNAKKVALVAVEWEPSDNSRMRIKEVAKTNTQTVEEAKALEKEMLTVYNEMRRCLAKTPSKSLAGTLAYGQSRSVGIRQVRETTCKSKTDARKASLKAANAENSGSRWEKPSDRYNGIKEAAKRLTKTDEEAVTLRTEMCKIYREMKQYLMIKKPNKLMAGVLAYAESRSVEISNDDTDVTCDSKTNAKTAALKAATA